MKKKPTVLMILDGYGMRDTCEHNAVCEAKTPIMDQLMSQCPSPVDKKSLDELAIAVTEFEKDE